MTDATQVSPAEWDAWRSFITMNNHLDRSLGKQLQSAGDISRADYEVLIALFEAPNRQLRARELGARIGWEPSRLSHQVSRMVKRELLERRECDSDGRGVWITLRAAGKRAVLGSMRQHSATIRELFFDVLSSDELATLKNLSDRVLATIDPPPCDEPGDLDAPETPAL